VESPTPDPGLASLAAGGLPHLELGERGGKVCSKILIHPRTGVANNVRLVWRLTLAAGTRFTGECGNHRNLTVFSASDILCPQDPCNLLGALMEWSTKPGRADQPFGSWADDLAAAFVRLEPRRVADQPFEGAISRVEAAPIQISLVTATGHTVLRLASHIASSTDDLCFVNLQLEGLGQTIQRGHEQISAPGDLALADTTEPFEIAHCHNFKLFCFAVPRRLLPKGLLDRPRLRLSTTETGRALSRTLAGYADLCLSGSQLLKTSTLIGAHVTELISHAPEILADISAERVHVPVLLSIMLDHIDRHSDDPELGAATLAARFRCSERYVHRLFATTGRPVGEHVNEKRIAACTRLLLDHNSAHKTIAEIAYAAGFRDISHFNRLFKRCNGLAPREFRRAAAR
jgi:AraC family transcriptional regulator, positive regulator of tynA and feaB